MIESSHIPKPATQLGLKNESVRLKTFRNWPSSHIVSPERLARAGFYYFNNSDATKCPYCLGVFGDWKKEDDPDREHSKHFPLCPFVKYVIRPRLQMKDAIQESEAVVNVDLNQYNELDSLGLILCQRPYQEKYATLESRLQSFESWPKFLQPNPKVLAEAGFYYNGRGDEVFCFACGGGIKHWEPSDDPWIEHAKYYHKCNYLLLAKGKEFINVISKHAQNNDYSEPESSQTDHHQFEENASYCLDGEKDKLYELEQENKRLRESRLCKICMDKEVGIVFLPCRHLAVCSTCVPNLSKCPVCRKSIKVLIKTYFT